MIWQPVQPLFCSGRAAAAWFGRSAAVANVRAMVKQGGSETAENDGECGAPSMSAVFAWSRLTDCPACRVRVPARGGPGTRRPDPFFKETEKMSADLFRK